ncbi:hypothetical protein H8E77_05255 [bacterium]|nr:hypothetical protein [bacterium]
MYFAKPAFEEQPPATFNPTPQQLQVASQQTLSFIGVGKKSYDDIEKYLLVELGYAATYGATGKHVEQLLKTMVEGGDIKQGETFYPVPPPPEIV